MLREVASSFTPLDASQCACIAVGVIGGIALTLGALWLLCWLEARRLEHCLRDGKIIRGIRP